jgi:hypothetical protein
MERAIRKSRFVWALLTLGLSLLATRCGGESIVRPRGDAGEGPETGGTGGVGVGGGFETGGVGGQGIGGRGGAGGSPGVGGMAFGGASGSGLAGFPQGGTRSDPFAHCLVPPLPGGTTCALVDACADLECGEPWSLHGADGCLRTTCSFDADCDDDSRCVPAPVAGRFDDFWSSGCESCAQTDKRCICSCYDDATQRAVCLTRQEFPPSADCSIAGLSCAELSDAARVVGSYLASEDWFELQELLEACRDKLRTRFSIECAGGQGGEGGSG